MSKSTIPSPPVSTLTMERLLGAGYFPEVLPPCFSTETFGIAFQATKTTPTDFEISSQTSSKCSRYNQARVGGMRRTFSIPNPVHFYRLAKCFLLNWPSIEAQATASPISLTKPVISNGKRCFTPAVDFRDRPTHRARVRATARFILRCDIARFFPSIYTHSIPWAFHTKSAAKTNRSKSLFGNELDKHFRNMQDGQTIGIPIGQDISRIIAESILSRVESDMGIKNWPTGIRCIDDYEIGFIDSGSAHAFLNKLQQTLADYELDLNQLKTAVLPLPQLYIDRWDAELRSYSIGTGHPDDGNVNEFMDHRPNKNELLIFFNKAIDLQRAYPDEAVLRFSVKRVAHFAMTTECWPFYQDYLLHCALNQPETLRLVVSNLMKAVFIDKMPLDKPRLKTVLDAVITVASPIGHSSDVAWALWAALVFKIKISSAASGVLSNFEDSVVGCLSCHAIAEGLLSKSYDPKWIKAIVSDSSSYYGQHWLIAYEAARNGWVGATTPASSDACFSFLFSQNVRFYDEDHANWQRNELINSHAPTSPLALDDIEDTSDSEDAFDGWWFREKD